MVDTKTMCDA